MGDFHDPPEALFGIDEAGRVVGIDDKDADNTVVTLHLALEFRDVWMPVVIRVHPVGVRRKGGVVDLREKMGGVGRLRHDDAGVNSYGAVCSRDCVAEAVEKDDVLFVQLVFSPLVYLLREKSPGFIHPLGGRIGVRDVIVDDLRQGLLHPFGDLFPLHHRITDVFPGNLNAVFLKLFSYINDVAYLVRYPCSALRDIKSHGRLFL